jgi:hypothetical protein
VRLRAFSACIKVLIIATLGKQQVSGLVCYPWRFSPPRQLGARDSIEHVKKVVKLPWKICVSFCAHLVGVVKINSSGIEVWSGSLVLTGSRAVEH